MHDTRSEAARSAPSAANGGARPDRLPFIDGLRAVAVLAIVAFHVRLPGTQAGFLGVDVFFVISGFLILGLVERGLREGRFSAIEFLARRALRILPPLFVVIALTLAAAAVAPLTPDDWAELTASSRAAALFVANVYFASKVGYFDTDAEEKPMLHLWSLSVEEQFYLAVALAGLAALALRRRYGTPPARALAITAAAALVASFALSVASPLFEEETPFYLTPFRAWQFLLGGAAAYVVAKRLKPPTSIAWIGAALIAFAFAGVSSPQLGTLAATFGAALTLAGGALHPAGLAPRALSARPMRAIGLVSYSWYLWHWPALFFMRAANFGRADLSSDLLAGAISLALAVLTFAAVERPLQRLRAQRLTPRGNRLVVVAAAGAIAAMVGAATVARPLGPQADAIHDANKRDAPRLPSDGKAHGYRVAQTAPDAPPTVLLYGDSHGGHLRGPAMRLTSDVGVNVRLLYLGGCLPISGVENATTGARTAAACRAARSEAVRMTEAADLKGVIVTGYWPIYLASGKREVAAPDAERVAAATAALRADLKRYVANGLRVLVTAPLPVFDVSPVGCAWRARSLAPADARLACGKARPAVEANLADATRMIRDAAAGLDGVRVIAPLGLFCDPAWCAPLDGASTFFSDTNHVNARGADMIYDAFRDDFAWVAGG